MSSLQGVGREGFHCIQRCPHSRVLEERGSTVYRGGPHSRVLEERGSTVYRGVLTPGCWNRGVPLYTEVYSLQGVGIEGFHCIQRRSSLQGVGREGFHCIQRCPHSRVLE